MDVFQQNFDFHMDLRFYWFLLYIKAKIRFIFTIKERTMFKFCFIYKCKRNFELQDTEKIIKKQRTGRVILLMQNVLGICIK